VAKSGGKNQSKMHWEKFSGFWRIFKYVFSVKRERELATLPLAVCETVRRNINYSLIRDLQTISNLANAAAVP